MEEMFQSPATLSLQMVGPGDPSRPAIEARMLLLPLKSDLGDVSRALGCLVTKGEIGLAPRRFELVSLQSTPLVTPDGSMPSSEAPAPVESPVNPAEFAEPTVSFDGKSQKNRPPYLRLVKTDE